MSQDRLLLAVKARRGRVPEARLVDGKMVETVVPNHRLELSTMCKAADVLWLLWFVDSDAAVLAWSAGRTGVGCGLQGWNPPSPLLLLCC